MDKFQQRISKKSRNLQPIFINPKLTKLEPKSIVESKNHLFLRNNLYNTNPCLVHCPNIGNSLNKFPNLLFLQDFLDRPAVKIDSSQYTIIFYNNKKNSILQKSMQRWNFKNIIHLGQDQIWENFMQRIKLLIQSFSKIKTEFFFFLDAFDVVICNDLTQAIKSLTSKKCDALYNAETAQYPIDFCTKSFERSIIKENPQCFLNAGVSVWKTKFFKEIMSEFLETSIDNDQCVIKLLYQKYFPRIQIDSNSESFQVISPPNWGIYMRPYLEILKC
jgi:hypothetical protein